MTFQEKQRAMLADLENEWISETRLDWLRRLGGKITELRTAMEDDNEQA